MLGRSFVRFESKICVCVIIVVICGFVGVFRVSFKEEGFPSDPVDETVDFADEGFQVYEFSLEL